MSIAYLSFNSYDHKETISGICFYLISENLIDNLKAEIKRLQRRKQLQYNSMETSDGSSSGGECESPSRSDKPLFTFKQVSQKDIT